MPSASSICLMCRLVGEVGAGDLDQPMEMVVLVHDDGLLFGARRHAAG